MRMGRGPIVSRRTIWHGIRAKIESRGNGPGRRGSMGGIHYRMGKGDRIKRGRIYRGGIE